MGVFIFPWLVWRAHRLFDEPSDSLMSPAIVFDEATVLCDSSEGWSRTQRRMRCCLRVLCCVGKSEQHKPWDDIFVFHCPGAPRDEGGCRGGYSVALCCVAECLVLSGNQYATNLEILYLCSYVRAQRDAGPGQGCNGALCCVVLVSVLFRAQTDVFARLISFASFPVCCLVG